MKPVSQIEEWMFSTIRIETVDKEGMGYSGTGFIFGYPTDNEKSALFLVTNRHVIENQVKGELLFIKNKNEEPHLDESLTVPISDFQGFWHNHPDPSIDVAIMPFGIIMKHIENNNQKIFYRFVNGRINPKKDDYLDIDAMEEIIFIGYPVGLYDKKNHTPIIRKGITATPIYLEYDGERKFLIDAAVFPGSSGSPVFIHDNNIHWSKTNREPNDSRILFVGIISKRMTFDTEGKIIVRDFPAKKEKTPLIHENIHLGIVFKPETIMETIEDFLKKRSQSK
jgi:hypothetical protein